MSEEPDFVDPEALKPGQLPKHLLNGPEVSATIFPAPHRWATRGVFEARRWKRMLELHTQPELWPGGGSVQIASDRLPAWTFASFRDDTRVVTRDAALSARETKARVLAVHGLMVEYVDEPAVDGKHVGEWWGEHAFVAHTTGFHEMEWGERPPGPRWRVLLPFAAPVDMETAQRVAQWARHPRHDVGIVSPITEEVWRAEPVPAVGPGGYRWLAGTGKLLDAHQAVRELETWKALDTRVRAEQDLEGTALSIAVDRFVARHATPRLRPQFPLPEIPALREKLEALWPGRVLAIVGSGGSGRTALALQIAEASARAALPVLIVLTRMGGDEAVARLLSLETGIAARDLLRGEGAGIEAAARDLRTRCPSLHLWAPTASDRTLEALWKKVRATSDAHDGRPPLVVIDGVAGWAVDDPELGARTVIGGLRDASHAGTLAPDWPGAAVLLVGGLPHGRLDPDRLEARWRDGTLEPGAIEPDSGAVVALAIKGAEARAIVLKNRDGTTGPLQMSFDATRMRFGPA
ncbi:MAG: AAA family ATPase [Alphaproteobacteria bacterium]|nr:AAA family ATPase [Alphaproteobacteria bacterium]